MISVLPNYIDFHREAQTMLKRIAKAPTEWPIPDNLNLSEVGILDSSNAIEAILFLEQFFGRELPFDSIDPRVFFTISSMYNAFCRST